MKVFDKLIQEYFGQLTDEELTTITSYFYEEKLCTQDFFTRPMAKLEIEIIPSLAPNTAALNQLLRWM